MGVEWAYARQQAGLEHRKTYRCGEPVERLGQPRCSLCRELVQGEVVSVGVSETRDRYYHWYCYAHHVANRDG
jgi:hypothetical protein